MVIRRLWSPATLALLTMAAACGTSRSPPPPEQTSHFDMLRDSELASVTDHSALEAIRQFRPRWLRGRGPTPGVDETGRVARAVRGDERVQAYVDGIRQDIDLLDLLPIRDIALMRFLSASEATIRFGIDHEAGAILVTTRQ